MNEKLKFNAVFSILIIIIFTSIAFFPSVKNDFTNWDDNYYIHENTSIHKLSAENMRKIFSSNYIGNYQPVTILSYMAEYQIFGLYAPAYHFNNLLLHILNSLLVFFVILRISKITDVSLVCALLFGIHPMHVESVAWIAERKDVLSTFFLLLSFLFFLKYRDERRLNVYIFSIVFFILSLLSKPMGVTLPLILHLTDYLGNRKSEKKSAVKIIPFWVISAAFIFITMITQKQSGATEIAQSLSIFERICIASRGILFYLEKLIAPINLCSFYPYPEKSGGKLPLDYIISPAILAAFILIVLLLYKKHFKIAYGFLFFLITILPVSQIVPAGAAAAADRYTYIPYIGLFYILGEGLNYVYLTKFKDKKFLNILPAFLFFAVIFLFTTLSFNRCYIWKDSITLWSGVINQYPQIPAAYNNRGHAFLNMGKFKEAVEDFSKSLKLRSDIYETYRTYYNRGSAYFMLDEFEKSIRDYDTALNYKKDFAEGYNNRGLVYMRLKNFDKSIEDYSEALKINPSYSQALKNRATAFFWKEKYPEALSDIESAIKIEPNYAQAYIMRARIFMKLKQPEKSADDFVFVIRTLRYPVEKKIILEFQKEFPQYQLIKN